MENFEYRILVSFLACFLTWVVWFVIASILHSKASKRLATEFCITAFLMGVVGNWICLFCGAIIIPIEYGFYLDNKDEHQNDKVKKPSIIKIGLIIVGTIMIGIQLIAIMGNVKTGTFYYFTNVTNFSVFIYDLMYFCGYYFIGIIGLVLLIVGLLIHNKVEE